MADWDSMDDDKKLQKVIEDFEKAKQFRTQYDDKWLRYYQLWRNHSDEVKEEGSNLFIPYIFSLIETVVPRLISMIFASRPYIGYLPTNAESVDRAKNMEALVDYQLVQKIRFIPIATSLFKEALLYGTSILKVGWAYSEEEVEEEVPTLSIWGIPLQKQRQMVTRAVIDEPIVEHIDLFDFYVDPSALCVDTADYCIHRVIRSKDYLQRKADEGIYKNIDALDDNADSSELGTSLRLASLGYSTSDKKGVEILEYFTDDRLIVVANQEVIIRDEPNPYANKRKPFIRVIDTVDPHNFYGIGEVEPVEHLQLSLNTIRNMRIDNINLIINKMWKVLRSSNIDPEQLISRPGGIIEVDEMDEIEEIKWTNVTGDSYNEDKLIREDLDFTSGVNDYVRGTNTDRRETATTASVMSQASNERIKLKATLIEDMLLGKLGTWLAELNRQFIDMPYTVRLLGDTGTDFVDLTNEDINGDFDVIAIGSSIEPAANKTARLNSLIQLYGIMSKNPHINQVEFTKKILEAADIKDISKIMEQPDMQPPQMEGGMLPGNVPLNPGATGMVDESGVLVNG